MLVVIYISLLKIIYYTLSPFFLFQCLNFFLIHENSLYIKAVIFFQLVTGSLSVVFLMHRIFWSGCFDYKQPT